MNVCRIQSQLFLYCRAATSPCFAALFLSSCSRVLTSQIGFVAVPVAMPAVTALARWIVGEVASMPSHWL